MKPLILAFSLLFSPLVAEVVSIPPSGDFARIDIKASNRIVDLLYDELTPLEQKRTIAELVVSHPGNYNPAVLVRTAVFLLSQQNIKESATLFARGLLRTEIDIRISQDKTVTGPLAILGGWINQALENYIENEKSLSDWEIIFEDSWLNFENWDRDTPRNYDQNWILLHSLDAFYKSSFEETSESEKQKITERFYREIKDELNDKDYSSASRDDPYYFDRKKRVFYSKGANLSFYLPESISPEFNRWGKYEKSFEFENGTELWLYVNSTEETKTPEEIFDKIINHSINYENYDESNHNFKIILNENEIPILKEYDSYEEEPAFSIITFHFVHGKYHFELEIECNREDEQFLLKEVEPLLASIKFDS